MPTTPEEPVPLFQPAPPAPSHKKACWFPVTSRLILLRYAQVRAAWQLHVQLPVHRPRRSPPARMRQSNKVRLSGRSALRGKKESVEVPVMEFCEALVWPRRDGGSLES